MVDWPMIASVCAMSRAKRLAGMRRSGPKTRSATPSGARPKAMSISRTM